MRLLIAFPFLLLLVLFALSNTAPAPLRLWPTDYTLELPLSLAILGGMAIAFLFGGALVWLSELAPTPPRAAGGACGASAGGPGSGAEGPAAPGATAMTVRVKICGINDPVAFDAAIAAGADWLGFQFLPAISPLCHAGTGGRTFGTLTGRSAARGPVRRSDAGDDRRDARHGAAGHSAALRHARPSRAAGPLRPADLAPGRRRERRRPAGRRRRGRPSAGGSKAAARRDAARR